MNKYVLALILFLIPTVAISQVGGVSGFFPHSAVQGGSNVTKVISTASTNATLIKGGQGVVYAISILAPGTTAAFVKFYDKATAPTCNTDTVKMTFGTTTTAGTMFSIPFPTGVQFNNGIGLCITGLVADNDNTNAVAGVVVNTFYK